MPGFCPDVCIKSAQIPHRFFTTMSPLEELRHTGCTPDQLKNMYDLFITLGDLPLRDMAKDNTFPHFFWNPSLNSIKDVAASNISPSHVDLIINRPSEI